MKSLLRNEKALKGTSWLPIIEIGVHPKAQRRFRIFHALDLYENFDPQKLGVLHVSRRPNGKLYSVDGQHRLYAVKKWLGDKLDGQLIECKVYEGQTLAEEADLFVGLNHFLRVSATTPTRPPSWRSTRSRQPSTPSFTKPDSRWSGSPPTKRFRPSSLSKQSTRGSWRVGR